MIVSGSGLCQARDRGLQGVEAVVQRQQSMSAEDYYDGLFLGRQCCRLGILGTGGEVAH
jgi:hypothetical protein